jgi:hypothetical protein
MALVVCEQCRRHVRHGESVCPFCGALRTPSRLGLGTAVILGAGLCLGGCGSGTDLGGGDAGVSTDGSSDSGAGDARDELPAVMYGPAPAYGLPPPDASADAADAGAIALYAAVPLYASVPHVE